MARRVRIGEFPDGTTQLQVSMPGYDAAYADWTDSNQMSFSTRWTDMAKIHQLGIAWVAPAGAAGQRNILFPGLGYTPFADVRRANGNVFYDDRYLNGPYWINEVLSHVTSNGISVFNMESGAGTVIYIVFRVPA